MKVHTKYLICSGIVAITFISPIIFLFWSQHFTPAKDDVTHAQEDDQVLVDKESQELQSSNNNQCRDYYFPCEKSFDSNNKTVCISRLLHCNQKIDCPNGEDELNCANIPIDLLNNLNITSHILKNNSTFLQRYEKNYHGNCSLYDLIDAKCVCDMTHKEKADCKNQGLVSIPDFFQHSITSINLERNMITAIDPEAINTYVNLTIISLRYNSIRSVPQNAFHRLSKLTRLYLRGNLISRIEPRAFRGLSALQKLYINENQLKIVSLDVFLDTPKLKLLDLAQNLIDFNQSQSFPHLDRLDWLDLSENRMTSVSSHLFKHLKVMTKIHLQENQISTLDEFSFHKNTLLTEINLSDNDVKEFPTNLFETNTQLQHLYLDMNTRVDSLPRKIFHPLKCLKSLNLTGVTILNVVRTHFSHNKNLTHLYFSKFKYCLYAPHVRVCLPSSDGVSSLEYLLTHSILRVSVWFVALITCIGNLTVVAWRTFSTKEDEVLSLFVKNLSVADFFMGIYLVVIGIQDVSFSDKYLESALAWMYSWKCTFIGVLAMISSQLSVLILTIVAIERYRSISFSSRLVTVTSAKILMTSAWFVAVAIAMFPVIYDYNMIESSDEHEFLRGEDHVTGYYGSNGLCFPLHIDDPFAPGWKYTAFIFLGINLVAVVSMLVLYTRMFVILNRDRMNSRPGCIDVNREDMILAVRFFFIVLTDCLCWLPIVIIKFVAFTQHVHPTIYAWIVVFILPINSAINPVIYTIAAPTAIRRYLHHHLRSWLKAIKCHLLIRMCPCCSGVLDETRSTADSTNTYMSEMLNGNRKRTSSEGSVITMALLNTPFLSLPGSRRTSLQRNSFTSITSARRTQKFSLTEC